MKICYLSRADNYHTYKWCSQMSKRGHEVHVISFIKGDIDCATVHYVDCGIASGREAERKKLKYLTRGKAIRRIIDTIRPDIVHAHYISSYGLAAVLAGIPNCVISVWGSDIYEFPQKSTVHKALIQFVLRRAGQIWSTSHAMAEETHKYTKRDIEITPFGVDMRMFCPERRTRKPNDGKFVIGTVKALKPKYGIAAILQAGHILKEKHPDIPLSIRIAGKGEQEEELRKLAHSLGMDAYVDWLGFISQEEAAAEWANMDCALILSESESFGVSAVEAQACAVPVIITDIPGLKEATLPGKSSMVVARKSPEIVAEKVVQLYDHPELREKMGQQGYAFVRKEYDIEHCFDKIDCLYKKIVLEKVK